jgi:hypothetical protein
MVDHELVIDFTVLRLTSARSCVAEEAGYKTVDTFAIPSTSVSTHTKHDYETLRGSSRHVSLHFLH